MKYRNFIFDLDGTLADTSPGVFEGIRLVLRQMGEPPVPEDQLSRFIGPPLHISFAAVCGMKDPRLHEAVGIFREYYKNGGVYNSVLYPGMEQLLRTLKEQGAVLMVATLKREEQAVSLIEHMGLSSLFSAVVGGDDAELRTKKDNIELAMRLSGASDKSATLMIGDSEFDAVGAEQAGVDFCAANYGFGLTPEVIAKHPCAVEIASPLELLEKL